MRPKPFTPQGARPTLAKPPRQAPSPRPPKPSKAQIPARPGARARVSERTPHEETQTVYGISAVLAVMAQRPEQVLSIAHTRAARKPLANVLREAARRRIGYGEVDQE